MARQFTAKRLSAAAAALLCTIPLTGCLFDYTDGSRIVPEHQKKTTASPAQTTAPPPANVTETTAASVSAASKTTSAAETTVTGTTQKAAAAQLEYEIIRNPDGTETATVTGFAKGVTMLPAVELAETPEGIPITQIGDNAFRSDHNIGLQMLVLTDSVTHIGKNAFRDSFLRSFSLAERENPLIMDEYAFYHTEKISTLHWSDCHVRLGAHCFAESGVNSVTLSGDLNARDECFAQCGNLTAVTLSDGELVLGNQVFWSCHALESVTLRDAAITAKDYFCASSGIRKLRIENCTGSAGSFFCSACPFLETVEIGEGITALGPYAFRECTALRTVRLPASLKEIDESCFYGCGQDFQIIAPEGSAAMAYAAAHGLDAAADVPDEAAEESFEVYDTEADKYSGYWYHTAVRMEFPEKACCGNSSLESIRFEDGVRLGDGAFSMCRALKKAAFESCEEAVFGNACFSGCAKLKTITFHMTNGTIGSYAFSRNPSLEQVTIGKGITEIGSYAFSDCPKLRTVILPESVTVIHEDAFSGCPDDIRIYAPKNSAAIDFAVEKGFGFEYR